MKYILTILLVSIVLTASAQQTKWSPKIDSLNNRTAISFTELKGVDTSYWGDYFGIYQNIRYVAPDGTTVRVENGYEHNKWIFIQLVLERNRYIQNNKVKSKKK